MAEPDGTDGGPKTVLPSLDMRVPSPTLPYRHGYGYSTITLEEYRRWEQSTFEEECDD